MITFLRKSIFLLLLLCGINNNISAQSGTDFWFAPPDVTDLHNPPGGEPLYLLVSSMGQAATVTISQPANGSFSPIVVNVAANRSARVNLTAFKTALETRPTNTVVNTGLRIQSTTRITCYYEVANTNNTDIWALKGPNALGQEFYIPLHKHAPFFNHTFAAPHQAAATFDIVATQNNTVVTIYSPVAVDGHPALQQFSVTLNAGQTYSCGFTGTNYEQPANHPSGAVVLADKPIAVSLKDDSNHNPSGGCYDLMGDQIVPVSILGEDYVAVKGSLNNTGDESVVILATENNTQIYIDGASTPVTTLFAGEYYRVDMDYLASSANNSVFIHATRPIYAVHITGFGCESGMAILPPLNCAGSQQVNFVRSSAQTFYLTLLVRSTAINNFTITGPGTATINPASFVTVPGTGGTWRSARIQYTTTEIPVDSTFIVTNSADVFALGIINGGATSGCKYGYFSEFFAPINTNAGPNLQTCANTAAQLVGSVSGGSTTGQWTSSGTGAFIPNSTTLNAQYMPSPADAALGTVTLTLTSTGACTPVADQTVLTIAPAPVANAGPDVSVCRNNANVSLGGSVTNAGGGIWTGGAGTFVPNNTTLNAVYSPTSAELLAGSLVLTLTTTANGICNPANDNVLVTFTPAPVVNAGANITRCGNNAAATLAGSVSNATGGVWTGGGGGFAPSATSLNAVYTPTLAEINAGSITLTLTSTGNGNCNSVNDQVTIFYSAPPTANAGGDLTRCANNPAATLSGAVTIASGGVWSGGLGAFSPNANALNATYTATSGEIASGSVTLTLTTTGNGTCTAVTDQIIIFFTPAPTVNAGNNIVVCANNATTPLNGSVTVASGAIWSGGTGTFSPSNTALNANYTPSPAEIAAGSVSLTLTSTGNGGCNAVSDQVLITITPAPTVNAGPDINSCANVGPVQLSGQVFVASGGIWSGGGGTFTPNANTLNALYTPSLAEISSGQVTLTLTSTGNGSCSAVTDNININFAPSPVANAGANQTVCGNNAVINLNGFVNFCAGGQWSGGLGTFNPSPNALNVAYTPTLAEINAGQVQLILTTTGNGACNAVQDTLTITITPAPTVNAGNNIMSCANNPAVTLNGIFTVANGAIWSGGTGSFAPSNTAMNATYTPTPAEIIAGSVTLTLTTTGNGQCLPVNDSVLITITPAPSVNAGASQTVCVTNLNVSLSGSVSGPTNTGIWSTSGTGTFAPNATSLNATYICSAGDSINGSVLITLTSTNNGSCNAVTDTMTISILPAGTANAGNNQTVCGNNASVLLNGQVGGGATTGFWSTTGTGVFVPNNATLNATYVPSSFDIALGNVTLFLTANSCNNAVDSIAVLITPAPLVNAGADITTCANTLTVQLGGTVSGATTTGIWTTTGSGTFAPNATALNATYTASAADSTQQTISIFLTSTNNGTCIAMTDTLILNIFPQGISNAGPDQIVCSNNAVVQLSGTITGGATQGIWTTTGSGFFSPNATTLNATYVPSAADTASGNVSLILTATNSCNSAVDFMTVIFTPGPSVDPGISQSICGSNPSVTLNGVVQNAAGGIWSGGNGTFTPSNTALNAIYTPSVAEVAAGSVTLTLTSTGNGSCNAEAAQVNMFFTQGILVNAGVDQSVCESASFTQLQGIVTNGSTTGVWNTLGSGIFMPNDSALNALYQFSIADTAAGSITLVLTSTNNGSCPASTDTLVITFGPSAFAWAGNDQSVCSSDTVIQLSGLATGGATQGTWTTSGSGTFADDSLLATTYTLSAADFSTGFVTIYFATTDHGSCQQGVDSMLISITPASITNAGGDITICGDNLSVLLNGNISGASTTGIWSTTGSGSFIPDATTLNATYIQSSSDSLAGSVTLFLTATNTGVCVADMDSMVVSITSPALVDAGANQTICALTSSVQLSGLVSGGTTTGIWTSTGTGTFTPSTSDLNASYLPSPADLISGFVILTLTSTGNGICAARSDTVRITLEQAAIVLAGNDRVVCGSDSTLQLGGVISGLTATGVWSSTGSGNFVPDATTLAATYALSSNDMASGSFQLILTSTNNAQCPAQSDTINVTVEPQPTAAFTFAPTAVELELLFTDQSQGAVSWLWGFSALGSATQQNPSYVFPQAGTYTITLVVTSSGGCTDTAQAIIPVLQEEIKPAAVPTGFTPNNDGLNDVLTVLGGPFSDLKFQVFNAWGNEVFSTTDASMGWDGTFKGKPQPAGVYTYIISGTLADGRVFSFSGNTTLLR
jgi:gliding motility-associated-like protein